MQHAVQWAWDTVAAGVGRCGSFKWAAVSGAQDLAFLAGSLPVGNAGTRARRGKREGHGGKRWETLFPGLSVSPYILPT